MAPRAIRRGGIRGVGSALARASRWNQVDDYLHDCEEEICVLVQVESVNGLDNIDAIAGPRAWTEFSLVRRTWRDRWGCWAGSPDAQVQQAIVNGIATVRSAGKAAGVLTADVALAHRYLAAGAQFVAVGWTPHCWYAPLPSLRARSSRRAPRRLSDLQRLFTGAFPLLRRRFPHLRARERNVRKRIRLKRLRRMSWPLASRPCQRRIPADPPHRHGPSGW